MRRSRLLWSCAVVFALGACRGSSASPLSRSNGVDPATNDRIAAAVTAVLQGQASFWNTSFSAAFVGSPDNQDSPSYGLQVAVAAGIEDYSTGQSITPDSVIPMGSVTKSWTMAAVMRAVEAGKFTLDSLVTELTDEIMMSDNGTTLIEIFQKTADDPSTAVSSLKKITVRMLLGMSSGLQDYNDTWYEDVTINDPAVTVTPYDLIWRLNKTFLFEPGTPGQKAYSSVGYEILGLILAQSDGSSEWTKYSQLQGAIPIALLPEFNATYFPTSGLCSAIPNMIEQYMFNTSTVTACKNHVLNSDACRDALFLTLFERNCVNGWTCGNIAATPLDVARFYSALGGLQLFHDLTLLGELAKFQPLTQGWCSTCHLEYSLGLMIMTAGLNASLKPAPSALLYGHGGADFGSGTQLAGFNPTFSFAVTVAMGSASGMNYDIDVSGPARQCNASDRTAHLTFTPAYGLNSLAATVTQCLAYAAFLENSGFAEPQEALYIDFRVYYPTQWVYCDQIGGPPIPEHIGLGVKAFQCTSPPQFIYYDCASFEFNACCAASGTNCTMGSSIPWFIANPLCTGYIPCLSDYDASKAYFA